MTWAVLLTRALLIPLGALSGALVGAAVGGQAALPDPALGAGSSPGYVLLAVSFGAVPGGVLGAVIGGLTTGLLFAGELVAGVRSRHPVRAAVLAWGGGVWLVGCLAVAGVLALTTGVAPITSAAPPTEALIAQWSQPLALTAVAAGLLALGIGVERVVVLRSSPDQRLGVVERRSRGASRGGSAVP
ncbi:hypothetical protein NY547_00765 [Cnuibacter physcomitrellae]|uniref:hypothetical protein n=1 Tax=Cnuibacter physcomitrellae TaxID=1619308 RepID=UPI002175BBFA|nr:hypothetical protein [Cnuibacter physcomitrellae]MCS5495769.1 hypothetical protein [Cnuibacter physcomitrellae]